MGKHDVINRYTSIYIYIYIYGIFNISTKALFENVL